MDGLNIRNKNLLSYAKERLLLDTHDEYGGVGVDHGKLPSNPNAFASMLRNSLSNWRTKAN